MENIVSAFVKGRLKVAKDRLYCTEEEGGLGLINIRDYISALQVSWFKKIMNRPWDNWRRDIFSLCGGNIFIANNKLVTGKNCPILEGLFAEFDRFRLAFLRKDNNLAKSDLLYNPIIIEARELLATITETIFAHNIPRIGYRDAAKIKISELIDDNGVKSLDNMCAETGLPLTLATYLRLAGPLNFIADKIRNRQSTGAMTLEQFFTGFKKGSKPIRKILNAGRKIKQVTQLQTVKTFFRLIGVPVPVAKDVLPLLEGGHTVSYQTGAENSISNFTITFWALMLGLHILWRGRIRPVPSVRWRRYWIHRTKALHICFGTAAKQQN
jgi:hypothetical protein